MRIRLASNGSSRSYDTQLGRFTDREAIPCFRCGVCCQRWQPLVGPTEVERLAERLGLTAERFVAEYARPYPLEEAVFQLNEVNGGCVFLRFEDGLAACAVHEARPQACRDWDASLQRKECLDGLSVDSRCRALPIRPPRFDVAEDATAFARHLRSASS
ncbi:MAG: YkgJ family cysteine cluster protein [Dehalococcoidia bacterium]